MQYGIEHAKMVDLDRVFLDHENPRHEPYDTQAEVIDYLCRDELVVQLAEDVAKFGLNPLELFALTAIGEGPETYLCVEGNRRLCALKLLNDPDLAPAKYRKTINELSGKWEPITQVFASIFPTKDSVDVWLDRIHNGQFGGLGSGASRGALGVPANG